VAKIMFVNRNAPHGTIYAWEGLEVILIFGAYENELAAVYMDDGVFCLKKGQDTSGIGIKGFIKTLPVLEDYGCEKIYVDKESMEKRGLTTDDFAIPVEVMDSAGIGKVMAEQDVILPF
jgi:tRNA 2-thiouridine synthesizing protein C